MNKLQWKLHYREQRISSKEEWKPVVGYEGLYEVSSFGRVRSLVRKWKRTAHILYSSINSQWYVRCNLYRNSKSKSHKIHRLVGKSFISNTWNKQYINHINWVKHDNRINNLEWCTPSENLLHSYGIWLHKVSKKNYFIISNPNKNYLWIHHNSKCVWQYTLDWIFISMYDSTTIASKASWVTRSNISHNCNGKTNSAWWYVWRFIN